MTNTRRAAGTLAQHKMINASWNGVPSKLALCFRISRKSCLPIKCPRREVVAEPAISTKWPIGWMGFCSIVKIIHAPICTTAAQYMPMTISKRHVGKNASVLRCSFTIFIRHPAKQDNNYYKGTGIITGRWLARKCVCFAKNRGVRSQRWN